MHLTSASAHSDHATCGDYNPIIALHLAPCTCYD